MVFTIDGVNILPYIEEDGIKWQRNDLESPDAGRALDGVMYRGRVAMKVRMDITCRPLYSNESTIVLNAIFPEYVTVTYEDPLSGTVVTKQMYSNNVPATCATVYPDGTAVWNNITFPLIER